MADCYPPAVFRTKSRRFTSAHAIALVALFISLSGTSYAISKLPKNSVGSPQVKDGSLTARDLEKGVLTSGPQGVAGVRGPRGPEGAAGAPGTPGTPGVGRPPIVSRLPAAPQNADEVYLEVDVAGTYGGPYLWHLRYRSDAAGPYKWDVLTGTSLYLQSATPQPPLNQGTPSDGANAVAIAVPIGGIYEATAEMTYTFTGGGPSTIKQAPAFGTGRAIRGYASSIAIYPGYFSYDTGIAPATARGTVPAGEMVVHQHWQQADTPATGTVATRALTVAPIRVG